jgi:hypothetical protein
MFKPRCLTLVLAIFAVLAPVAAYQDGDHQNILWTDPGDPSALDFKYGVGGSERQPQPPFRFVDEDTSGTAPKINVTDGRGMAWNVKWRHEVRPSTFCTRLVWACGYFVDTEYFVAKGRVEGVQGLKRAKPFISSDGSFANARFQLRTGPPNYMKDKGWSWTSNPFSGTRELNGLKILMLLVSNWDAKDSRDKVSTPNGSHMDSNLAIFEDDRTGVRRYLYAEDDWGASMGKWGGLLTWTKWDCKGFQDQTSDFVKGVENGRLRWGFNGKHRKDLTDDISVSDLQWLMQYLGKITDEQIHEGLEASGARPEEITCYSDALRRRIERLRQVISR